METKHLWNRCQQCRHLFAVPRDHSAKGSQYERNDRSFEKSHNTEAKVRRDEQKERIGRWNQGEKAALDALVHTGVPDFLTDQIDNVYYRKREIRQAIKWSSIFSPKRWHHFQLSNGLVFVCWWANISRWSRERRTVAIFCRVRTKAWNTRSSMRLSMHKRSA